MISPPANIVWSLELVPVFEWESCEPENCAAAPPPVTPNCDVDDATLQQHDAQSRHLVFKGYEWRPTAEYVLFPPAPWADAFDGGSSEATAESVKEENERRARANEAARQHRAQFHPHQPDLTIEPTKGSTAASDGSSSDE
jgi:hypothetical protein